MLNSTNNTYGPDFTGQDIWIMLVIIVCLSFVFVFVCLFEEDMNTLAKISEICFPCCYKPKPEKKLPLQNTHLLRDERKEIYFGYHPEKITVDIG